MKKLKRISFSQVKLWGNCPRQWWAKYVEEESTPSSDAAQIGSAFGEVVQAKSGATLNPKSPSAERGDVYPTMTPEAQKLTDAMVKLYRKQKWAWKKADESEAGVELTEKRLKQLAHHYGLPNPKGIYAPFVGYIDLLRRNPLVEIIDLKTSSRRGFQPDWMLQLNLYAMAVEAVAAGLHMVTTTKVPVAIRYDVPLTKDTLSWSLAKLLKAYEEIEAQLNRQTPPAECPGFWCSWCPRTTCQIRYALDCASAEGDNSNEG